MIHSPFLSFSALLAQLGNIVRCFLGSKGWRVWEYTSRNMSGDVMTSIPGRSWWSRSWWSNWSREGSNKILLSPPLFSSLLKHMEWLQTSIIFRCNIFLIPVIEMCQNYGNCVNGVGFIYSCMKNERLYWIIISMFSIQVYVRY